MLRVTSSKSFGAAGAASSRYNVLSTVARSSHRVGGPRLSNASIRISSNSTTSVGTPNSAATLSLSSFPLLLQQQLIRHLRHPTAATATTETSLRAFGAGAVAGLVTSLAGLGGALLLIPVLVAAPFGLAQHAAHGTSLMAVAACSMTGAVTYSDHLDVYDPATVGLAVAGMVAAPLGARFTTQLSSKALKRALAALMLSLSVAMLPLKDYVSSSTSNNNNKQPNTSNSSNDMFWQRIAPYTAVGGASGFLAGLFGIGGGTMIVPVLTILSSNSNNNERDNNSSHYQILATSLAATSLSAAVGCVAHAKAGNIVWRLAPALCTGASLGAMVGGQLVVQDTVDQTTLRTGVTALLAVLGARTLLLR